MQGDILVPPDASSQGAPPVGAPQPREYLYAVAGNTLVVLRPQQVAGDARTAVVRNITILPSDSEAVVSVTLQATESKGTLDVRCGLTGTFRANAAVVADGISGGSKLIVVGTATQCMGTNGGGSPRVVASSEDSAMLLAADTSTAYYSTTTRPLPTAVAITFDLSDAAMPRAIAMTQVEGHFERIHIEGNFGWLFIATTTHQPYDPEASSDTVNNWSGVTDSQVMPVFRTRTRQGDTWRDWAAWNVVQPCSTVRQIVHSNADIQHAKEQALLLVAMPVPLALGNGAAIGVPAADSIKSYVVAQRSTVCIA